MDSILWNDYNSMIIQTVDGRILYVDLYGHLIAEFVDGQWICAF